jgi:putative lipoprotein
MDTETGWHLAQAMAVAGMLYATTAMATPGTSNGTAADRERLDDTDILVQRVDENPHTSVVAHPAGRWLAEDIRRGGVIDRLQTVLEIAADGTITGTGGCNRMMGKATISGETIAFGPLASTNMACTPAAMNQEQKFFAALGDARTWRIDPVRQKLVLLDADGKPIVILARM